jgi:hypothetical protein
MPIKPAETLVVLEAFVGLVDGEVRAFRAGDLVRSADPAVRKWPHLFGPAEERLLNEPKIEQATAGPGEKRGA